ncbi:hypothetical protein [Candidatus Hodarchaeum mangrovi]
MSSLDLILSEVSNFFNPSLALLSSPSNILLVVPELEVLKYLNQLNLNFFKLRFVETRDYWLDIHSVLFFHKIPFNITLRVYNPSSNFFKELKAIFPIISSFL